MRKHQYAVTRVHASPRPDDNEFRYIVSCTCGHVFFNKYEDEKEADRVGVAHVQDAYRNRARVLAGAR